MAILISSTYEPNPQDTGYVVQTDHYDDGSTLGPYPVPANAGNAQNYATILSRLQNALSNINNTYLALASPTNAQNAAQIQALTHEVNALIRLTLHSLLGMSSTAGT